MRKIVFLLLLAPSLAVASGYALPNTHPRDLGLCASGVAAQRDAAAAFALPAALARIDGPSVSLGGGAINIFDKWTDPTPGATVPPLFPPGTVEPTTADLGTKFTGIPDVAVSYGGKVNIPNLGERGWGVGLAIQPFGGAIVKWPDGWAGRYRITNVDREAFSAVLGAGIEVIPQVRLGGGLVYYRTMETFDLHAWMEPYPPPAGTPGAPDAKVHLDLDGGAFSYDASLEIDPIKGVPLTIAVDYKHKATQDIDGSVSWNGVSPFFLGAPLPGQLSQLQALFTANHAKQQLTIPNTLNVGVAYRVMKPLLVTFTYTFDRWVVYDQDLFNLSGGTGGANYVVPRNYSNGNTFRGGAEYDLTHAFQVRVGLQRDISGLDKSVYSPTLPDASSWAGSLGGTLRFGRGFYVDAAVFYAKMDKVNVPQPPGSTEPRLVPFVPIPQGTFRGSYEPSALVYTAAVAWTPAAKR